MLVDPGGAFCSYPTPTTLRGWRILVILLQDLLFLRVVKLEEILALRLYFSSSFLLVGEKPLTPAHSWASASSDKPWLDILTKPC